MLKNSIWGRVPKTILNIPARMPNYAQISITNICNLDCKMCFRHFLKLDIKHMDYDVLKTVVNKLRGVKTLALTGYGEPLAHPKFPDAVRYCKEKGFVVQTTSNGLLLKGEEKLTELILSGLDSISFSLESIHENSVVTHSNKAALANIRRLIEFKGRLSATTPSVTLQTLMLKNGEQDLYDVIEWGAENGVDRINVARFELNTLQNIERPGVSQEKKIFKEFDRLRRKHKIRIDCLQDQVGTGVTGSLYKRFKGFLGMNRNCIRLHDFIYINVDGYVNPCCALVEHKMGNLCKDRLEDIWNSKKYHTFRKSYADLPWCEKCDFAKLDQVETSTPAERTPYHL